MRLELLAPRAASFTLSGWSSGSGRPVSRAS